MENGEVDPKGKLNNGETVTNYAGERVMVGERQYDTGDAVQGAEFGLYTNAGEEVFVKAGTKKVTDPVSGVESTVKVFTVCKSTDDGAVRRMTTDENGQIRVDGIEWGGYYFEETKAPDGTKTERQRQELFCIKSLLSSETDENGNSFNTNSSDNEYWIELKDHEKGTDLSGDERTNVFGYSVYLKSGELTETLFDSIRLKNIIQYEADPDKLLDIYVQAYGIQADYVGDISKNDGSEKAVTKKHGLPLSDDCKIKKVPAVGDVFDYISG